MRERRLGAVLLLGLVAGGVAGWFAGRGLRGAEPAADDASARVARLEEANADLERRLEALASRPEPQAVLRAPTAEPGRPPPAVEPAPPAGKPAGPPAIETAPYLDTWVRSGSTFRFEPAAPAERLDDPTIRALLSSRDAADRARGVRALAESTGAERLPMVREAMAMPDLSEGQKRALASTAARLKDRAWSARQLTGEPDTPLGGDIETAWASKQEDMGEVTIDLDYARAVRVDQVRVRETFNPGAVARVYAKGPDGAWDLLWEGVAPRAEPPDWFEPPMRGTRYATSTIRVVVDTDRVRGWNEIDAVELVGDGERQWAKDARASSSYSD